MVVGLSEGGKGSIMEEELAFMVGTFAVGALASALRPYALEGGKADEILTIVSGIAFGLEFAAAACYIVFGFLGFVR